MVHYELAELVSIKPERRVAPSNYRAHHFCMETLQTREGVRVFDCPIEVVLIDDVERCADIADSTERPPIGMNDAEMLESR